MKSLATLGLLCLSLVSFSGCSTPQSRAQENPEAFARLSKEQQRLALEGKISEGMNEDAVYVALGRPSKKREGRLDGRDQLYWVYSRIVSREIPSYRTRYSRDRFGRVYADCYYDPFYDSYVEDTFRVIFENGKVVGWQELY